MSASATSGRSEINTNQLGFQLCATKRAGLLWSGDGAQTCRVLQIQHNFRIVTVHGLRIRAADQRLAGGRRSHWRLQVIDLAGQDAGRAGLANTGTAAVGRAQPFRFRQIEQSAF